MRLLLSFAVIAIASVSSPSVVDARDRLNKDDDERYNANKNKPRGRQEFLRRTEKANLARGDPLPDSLMTPPISGNAAPADPLPDYMQNEKAAILAPPDPVPMDLENEKMSIMAPADPLPDHSTRTKAAILAQADPVQTEKKTINCVLMEAIYLFAPGFEPGPGEDEPHQWQCEFHDWDNAILTLKGLPRHYFSRHEKRIKSGESILYITYDTAKEDPYFDASNTDEFWIPKGSTLALAEAHTGEEGFRQRRMASTVGPEGNHTILVVRVSDTFGSEPEHSASQMSDDIFGTGTDEHNLKSQYSACSAGKLNFIPAEGDNIVNGVAELEVPAPMRFESSSVVENWVLRLAPKELGPLNQWTLVMFILPNTVNFSGAAAYTYVNSRHSVFLDEFSNNLLVLMHEIGHNLGNRHSGKGSLSYDDGTCMMGAHVYEDDAPKMCFNGAKSFYFGWYDDAQVDIDPRAGPWQGQLVGVDDYVAGNMQDDGSQNVVARIPSASSPDLFLMYNRKKGINSQVTMNGNDVTIVQQDGEHGQSWLLAGISERDEPFRYDDWDEEDDDLIIEVCNREYETSDYAEVLIYLDNGTEKPTCPAGTPSRPNDESQEGTPENGLHKSTVEPGSELTTVVLPILSNQDLYREKNDGAIRTSKNVQNLFGPNWNKQGFRFESGDDWTIPKGVEIESAVLLVHPISRSKFLGRQMYGRAVGHAVGNASPVRSGSKFISNAPKTGARTDVGPGIPRWKSGRYENLVDVTPIVQELVLRSDYHQSNAIEIFLIGDTSIPGRRIMTPESGYGPMLEVKYMRPGVDYTAEGEKEKKPQVKEVELDILEPRDDYLETSKGSLRASTTSHNLWTSTLTKYAYRFQNVPIPQGAKVLEARLEMYGRSKWTMKADITGIIQGENVGNSLPFKYKNFQLTNAPKTTATVNVENLPQWKVHQYNGVGDVAQIIQEIVNRGDYSEGNAIKLILTNLDSPAFREVDTYESESGNGAKLLIRYLDDR